ncbi:MAG: hypothetical protein PHE51_06615 [Eubacteriales bacterium]|nr:hypothetical protein [Eubacteriales bacterium]
MKKVLYTTMTIICCLCIFSACGIYDESTTSSSIGEIQSIVRESQDEFEKGNTQGSVQYINQLIQISEDELYTENERLIAKYCGVYIKAGIMFDYLIKNDNEWVNSQDFAEFDILHRGLFVDVVNGNVTHNETLREYISGLVNCTKPIYDRYIAIGGK